MVDQSSSTYQRFARDVIVVGLATGLTSLTSILTLPLLTRALGAGNYGIWAQSNATISMVLLIVGLGLPFAMLRLLPAQTDKAAIRDDVYSALSLSFLAASVITVIMFIFADSIARTFFDGATQVVRLTALAILLTSPLHIYLSFFRAFRHMKTYSVLLVAEAYGQVIIIACLVLNGYGLVAIFLSLVAMKAMLFLFLLVYAARRIGIARPRFTRTAEYFRFALPALPSLLSWWVVNTSDRYVIGAYLGTASVGSYSAAYNIANIMVLVITALSLVLTPALSLLSDQQRRTELAVHLSYSLKYFLMLAIPFVVGAAVMAKPLLTLFSTPDIASRANVVLPLVALSVLVYGVYVIVGNVLLLTRRTALLGFIWLAAAALNLGLNILLVPRLGINAAALTTLIAYALVLGVTSHRAFRDVPFPIDWRFIAKSLVASGLMAAVVAVMRPETRPETVGTVLVGIVVYALCVLLLKAVRKDEISFFRNLLPTRSAPGD